MRDDRCIFLIKPDAIARGLVEPIRRQICEAGFAILAERTVLLTETMIRAYQPALDEPSEFGEDWKREVVELQTSAPVIIVAVERYAAMETARILKRNIRAQFSPGDHYLPRVVLNLLHAPSSPEELANNVKVLAPDWQCLFF